MKLALDIDSKDLIFRVSVALTLLLMVLFIPIVHYFLLGLFGLVALGLGVWIYGLKK